MGVTYLAARYSRRLELCDYRADLEARGHSVPARWLLGNHQVEDLTSANEDSHVFPDEQAQKFAEEDLEDIVCATSLIAFSEPPGTGPTRGGRHFELGFVCGVRFGRWPVNSEPNIYIVGPPENVFMSLPLRTPGSHDPYALINGRYPDWQHLLKALDAGEIGL